MVSLSRSVAASRASVTLVATCRPHLALHPYVVRGCYEFASAKVRLIILSPKTTASSCTFRPVTEVLLSSSPLLVCCLRPLLFPLAFVNFFFLPPLRFLFTSWRSICLFFKIKKSIFDQHNINKFVDFVDEKK